MGFQISAVLKYRSARSGRTVTTFLPGPRRLESSSADQAFAPEEVPTSEQASATEDPELYLNEKADMLNGLSTSDWEPDLSLLDSVLGSLRFETAG